jgi:hypothetical protein
MADIDMRIGLRRLYQAHGCEVEAGSMDADFRLGESFSASVRIGPRPQFGLYTGGFSVRYVAPGSDKFEVNYRYEPDIEKTDLAGKTLTEIVVSRDIQVEAELRDAFERGESAATHKLADLAYADTAHLIPALEFLAGLIGLRVASQFLAELKNETPVLWRSDGPRLECLIKGPRVLMSGMQLTNNGGEYLRECLEIGAHHKDDNIQEWGRTLGWLQKAWDEDEPATKFLWFFIPLERILGPVQIDDAAQVQAYMSIRRLIKAHAGDQKSQLLSAFNHITGRIRPSLEERFAAFARFSQAESCEADVLAFRTFNRIRNGLLHRGEPKVKLHVEDPSGEQVSGIQDIAERYISYAIFGDFRVPRLLLKQRQQDPQVSNGT